MHGGAVLPTAVPHSYRERADALQPQAGILAELIVGRLRDGQIVGLDAGSTGVEVARRLPIEMHLTIVTTSPPAAVALERHRNVTVILGGGTLDLTWMAVTGAEAVRTINSFRLDVAVLGVCGIHPDHGATTNSLAELETKRAWIDAAADVVVPVTADKLDRVAPFVIAPLRDITTVALAEPPSRSTARRYRAAGTTLITPS